MKKKKQMRLINAKNKKKQENEPIDQDTQEIKYIPICDKTTTNKGNIHEKNIDATAEEGTKGRKEGNNTRGKEHKKADGDRRTNKKGYMAAKGKPRQPRKTQEIRQEHYDMNMKQRPGTAQNAQKYTPNITQQVQRFM